MNRADLLRRSRTLLYRALSPAERLLPGRRQLPPLWLRRHVGAPGKFISAARETASWLDRFALVKPGATVLDIGCGCGAMVEELLRRLGEDGHYVGFDVHRPSIDWCRERYADDARLRFEWAAVESPYGLQPGARLDATSYRFPVANGTVDFVLAKSVFTHLLEDETRHYLEEIRRVLAADGSAWVTFFLFDGEREVPLFPFPDRRSSVRWRRSDHPRAAVAYERDKALALIESAGLAVRQLVEGFWPGNREAWSGQDQLVLAVQGAGGRPSPRRSG